MAWVQLTLHSNKQLVEAISAELQALGALSITYQDNGDEPQLEPDPGTISFWSNTRITGLFEETTNEKNVLEHLNDTLGQHSIQDYQFATLEDEDWEKRCLQDFKPLCFNNRLWVIPSWLKPLDDSATNLFLDPGLAFGTGTHPTTSLCLEWIAKQNLSGKTVIDYGCGSGILAVACAKMGAKEVIAIDHDPQALTATADNAKKNNVAALIMPRLPEQLTLTSADLIIANILAGPLISLAGLFSSLTMPGKQIVLSGILSAQSKGLQNHYQPWFKTTEVNEVDGWVCISAERAA